MSNTDPHHYILRLHPLHGLLLGGSLSLYLGALLSDAAYASSYQIQWNNFASWLIAGGLVFGGLALLCAVVALVRADRRAGYAIVYPLVLVATWLLGFVNALVHARDAWAGMPTGLVLSAIVFAMACVASWIGFAKFGVGGAK